VRRIGAAARKATHRFEVTANQSLFLCPAPAFDLSFGRNSVGNAIEIFAEDENDRTAWSGPTPKKP
jgi:hypothetical protein